MNNFIKNRLQEVMLTDKSANISQLNTVLKSDLIDLLQNYMEISAEDIDIKITSRECGDFIFSIVVRTDRLIDYGKMID